MISTNLLSHPLSDKTYYTAPIDYIISSYIREYDISKANINILLMKGIISNEEYQYLFHLDKMDRQVKIGILQKDQGVAMCLKEGIKEMRYLFLTENNLNETDILSIKNDAIFVINKIPTVTKFGNIEFVNKNVYTSFYKIDNGKLEIYYLYDMVHDIENMDIKGIKDEKILLHKDYFLEFLLVLFNSAQMDKIEETITILVDFYQSYINLELDINYYRQFNAESLFVLKRFGISSVYTADCLSNESKDHVEISHNLNILRDLIRTFSTIQNSKKR